MADVPLLHALDALDLHLRTITNAVHQGHPQALAQASARLRDELAVLLADPALAGAGLAEPMVQDRLKHLAKGLSIQRAGMLRRAALVDMTLHAMVPGTSSLTYGAPASPYGQARKQTGAFSTLAA